MYVRTYINDIQKSLMLPCFLNFVSFTNHSLATHYPATTYYFNLSQVDQLAIERDKFKKESDRLRVDLEKEKKDAQSKFDVYMRKTEQFQLQWKKREEAEDKINVNTYLYWIAQNSVLKNLGKFWLGSMLNWTKK